MIFFPYQKDLSGNYYPIIDFNIACQIKSYHVYCLIDSGAAISIFTKEVAEMLGIEIERGRETFLNGVASGIKGYVHDINFFLDEKRFKVSVVFSREFLVSFNLLGREGVFPHFKILFDEAKLRVGIEKSVVK